MNSPDSTIDPCLMCGQPKLERIEAHLLFHPLDAPSRKPPILMVCGDCLRLRGPATIVIMAEMLEEPDNIPGVSTSVVQ